MNNQIDPTPNIVTLRTNKSFGADFFIDYILLRRLDATMSDGFIDYIDYIRFVNNTSYKITLIFLHV